jgi:sugar lactone lactonase YvrE
LMGRPRGVEFEGVYRVAPNGTISLVDRDMEKPNGVALSPDEKRLYVSDTMSSLVRVFDVNADGSTTNGRLFTQTTIGGGGGNGDGIAIDNAGNVYVTTAAGVKVFDPSAKYLGVIKVAEEPSNVSFGDADLRTLYITAQKGLYRAKLQIPGIP